MKVNPLTRLRLFIANSYSKEDFRLLCTDLTILYDDLGGDERISTKADRLLYLIGQQRRYDDLLHVLQQTRSKAFEQGGFNKLTPEALQDALPVYAGEQVFKEDKPQRKQSTIKTNSDGRYEIQEDLGRGNFAVVYKAVDTALNRPVALKVLHPYWQEAPEFVARFKLEAQTAANLRHPNIVRVIDFRQGEDGRLLLAMEFLPGMTLEKFLDKRGPLTMAQAQTILKQVSSALDYAHGKGIVHRDLKPGNIMLEETVGGLVGTLTDFGLVKAMEGSVALTMHNSVFVGTVEYMAPEQADPNRQKDVGPAADRYALGVLAYRLLTGRVPFPGNSHATLYAHEYKPPPAPREINAELTESAEAALLKMLAKSAEDRFASCLEFVAALSRTRPGQSRPESAPKQISLDDRGPVARAPRDVWVHPKTGKEMVRVPAGPFLFGEKKEKRELPEFWIDKTPVTNAEYARFVAETGHIVPTHWGHEKEPPTELADHPVVWVSWEDANAYAEWAGGSLPSEEQWEKAARGTGGQHYPWRGEWKEGHCNTLEAGFGKTTPVGYFSPKGDSPFGCVDMSGNVWEWINRENLVKGGSWASDKTFAHVAERAGDEDWYDGYRSGGFRLVVANPLIRQDVSESRLAQKDLIREKPIPEKANQPEIQVKSSGIWLNPKSGKEMVHIPAGKFLFGENKEKRELPEFWIDKTPVTNAEYARFVAEKGYEPPRHWKGKKEPPGELRDHPVVYVSWEDANAYAKWAGGGLPSEEEWEKAARGTDGRIYPWGDEWQKDHCNTEEAGIGKTTPVDKFSPDGDSPYGCVDMSGNVWEWTSTKADKYYWLKGGSYYFGKDHARAAARHDHYWALRDRDYGFRLVVAAPSSTSDL